MQAPKAIIVGAGFSKVELNDIRSCEGGKSIPWLYPDPLKSAKTPFFGPFFMSYIVRRAKNCMEHNGLVDGKLDQVKPEVWSF